MNDLFKKAQYLYSRDEFEAAFKIFSELAENGDPDAMCWVAVMLGAGEGVEKNLQKSIEWDLKAINLGSKASFYNIGVNYKDLGNMDSAIEWLKRSADEGDADASLELLKIFVELKPENLDISRYLAMALNDDFTRDEAIEIENKI